MLSLFSLLSSLAAPALATADIEIIVLSDLNGSYGSTEYAPETHDATLYILDQQPDLVLITGDMVAGQRSRLPYRKMWEAFHEAVTGPLSEAGVPVAVTPGNHDASAYEKYEAEREIFVEQWLPHKPDVAFVDDTNYPLSYAFMFETVLFVSLDDTMVERMSREQKDWLDKTLSLPAAHKIVYGHVPLFPFARGRGREVLMDFELENILLRNGVDLFVSGHHHAYFPGFHNSIRYVGAPCLGSGSRSLFGERERSKKGVVQIKIQAGEVTVEGLDAAEEFAIIPRDSLPPYVEHRGLFVWRDDWAKELFDDPSE